MATMVKTIYQILKIGENTKDPSFKMNLGVLGWQQVESARDEEDNPLIFRSEDEAEAYLYKYLSFQDGWFVQPVQVPCG